MGPRFSIVYPTRHRPEFVRQALRILEAQGYDDFQVVVSDNYLDPALSCETICRETSVANVTYVRPPRPVGMVENWNHSLQFATGDYLLYLTDKMFVLPGALGDIEQAIEASARPEVVSWTSDAYNPASFGDYLGYGVYVPVSPAVRSRRWRRYAPADELDRRGRAAVSRGEQSSADYSRGKLVFGAYRRDLVERVVHRYGALFHDINPDYTSMLLALTEARDAIELGMSCVISVNTDISNGHLSDTDDAAAYRFLDSLAGGAGRILPTLLVPGLYVSLHNWVAHDFVALKRAFDLSFEFDAANWIAYCIEDVQRPGRRWSDPRVEVEQKAVLRTFLESLEPALAATVEARLAARAAPMTAPPSVRRSARGAVHRLLRPSWRRSLRTLVPKPWRRATPWTAPSIEAAVLSMRPRAPGAPRT